MCRREHLDHGSRCRRGHLYHRHDVLVHGIKREIAENDQPASLHPPHQEAPTLRTPPQQPASRKQQAMEQFNVLLRTNMYTLASRRPCVLGTHALQLGSRRLGKQMMIMMRTMMMMMLRLRRRGEDDDKGTEIMTSMATTDITITMVHHRRWRRHL